MRFCQEHWEALRAAIRDRGLGPLVSANGRDAAARTVAELTGAAEPDDFDPLMAAHWMIVSKAVGGFGLYVMAGDYCPICEALRLHPEPCEHGCTRESYERWWIDGPADAVLEEARRRGLLEPESA